MDILDAFWASSAQEEEETAEEEEAVAVPELPGTDLGQRIKFLEPNPLSFSLGSKAVSIITTIEIEDIIFSIQTDNTIYLV